mgnify:CR=1 FL=1
MKVSHYFEFEEHVTGGMAGKVRTLLDLSVPAHVFGPEGLEEFLDGGSPGTLVAGRG